MIRVLAAGVLAVLIGTAVPVAAATTFNFQFDNAGLFNEPDGTIIPPLVGTGIFVSPVDLGPGTYALSALGGYSMTFTVGPNSFLTSDEANSPSDVAVRITASGMGERLVFTEFGTNGDAGPNGGSLDLINPAGAVLTFEPSGLGGNYLYLSGGQFGGDYLALSVVPEPAAWALMIAGFGLIGTIIRRRSVSATDSVSPIA